MSRIKLLLDVVESMRSLADNLHDVAEAMANNEPEQSVSQKPSALVAKPSKKTVSLEEVRAVLAEKSQDGFTVQVRSLLEKYGAPKLSQIDPANYSALLADAEELK